MVLPLDLPSGLPDSIPNWFSRGCDWENLINTMPNRAKPKHQMLVFLKQPLHYFNYMCSYFIFLLGHSFWGTLYFIQKEDQKTDGGIVYK